MQGKVIIESHTRPVDAVSMLQAQLAAKDLQLQQKAARLVGGLACNTHSAVMLTGWAVESIHTQSLQRLHFDVHVHVPLQGVLQTAYAEVKHELVSTRAKTDRSNASLVSALVLMHGEPSYV